MIPIYKLETFPRSLKLRKIAKFLGEIEYRLSKGVLVPSAALTYIVQILGLLAKDDAFPPQAALVIRENEAKLKDLSLLCMDHDALVRNLCHPLNTIRHILLAETGQAPADWDFIDYTGHLDPNTRRCFPGMQVYLEDIRSPFNVGAMFRTAESFGAEKIFLSPLCADPHHPRAERTAMGCISALPWERLNGLEIRDNPLFALETGGIKLGDFPFPARGIMIVGSEELGVSPVALAAADTSLGRVSIPTYGSKGSLNASVAFGIAMQAWAEALQNPT